MTFATRRLVALAVLIAMVASLATAGAAVAASGTITQRDCSQGTIRDQRTNQPISHARCEMLVGRNVQLASTGLDLRPVLIAGVLCLAGAAALGLRRRGVQRLT